MSHHQSRSRIARKFLAAAMSVSCLMWLQAVNAQQDFSDVEIIPHHVAGSVYYLEGRGGNIGLSIGEDGGVMIDDQYAPLTEKILTAIRELNQGEIRFLINTHVHGDHTGGNENLGKLGVLILARDEVRVRLEAQSPKDALPVLTYSVPLLSISMVKKCMRFPCLRPILMVIHLYISSIPMLFTLVMYFVQLLFQ